jgi:hypothetical protein
MSIQTSLALIGTSLLLGCSFSASVQLYPVQGPLATQTPLPVLNATKTGLTSGHFSLVLPGGEICQGPWSLVRPVLAPGGGGQTESPNEHQLSSAWDSIHGAGFYVAQVLGARQYGRAKLVGAQGSIIYLEIYCSDVQNSPVLGVAQDNRGNTFKVTFS